MGDLNVYVYQYPPAKFFDGATLKDDLQAKLRSITGGGSGDPSKVHQMEIREILGTCCIICVVED